MIFKLALLALLGGAIAFVHHQNGIPQPGLPGRPIPTTPPFNPGYRFRREANPQIDGRQPVPTLPPFNPRIPPFNPGGRFRREILPQHEIEELRVRRAAFQRCTHDAACRAYCKSRHPSYGYNCVNGECDCA